MVYQALLFSSDEKASRVITRILTELEFHVEACAEPFAAVKQITTQHYDAVVVDCDNEQNATLLFKSARNSNSNSGSLAVALVQGQSGIAKAFRIGANLVLTKPIHAEQSKGTLRTAKGLLRKGEAARQASAASVATPSDATAPPLPTPVVSVAQKEFSVGPVASTALELQEEQFPKLGPADAALLESMPEPAKMQSQSEASGSQAKPWQPAAKAADEPMAIQTLAASASAAAPATINIPAASPTRSDDKSSTEGIKPSSATDKSLAEKKVVPSQSSRRETFAKSTTLEDGEPTFGQLVGHDATQPRASGNRRNFLIAAVLVLGAAVAINYGWPELQPLLTNLPIVKKYIAPHQAQHPPVAPIPAVAPPGSAVPSGSTGTQAEPGANVLGQSSTATVDAPASATSSPAANVSPIDKAASANPPSADSSSPLHLAPEVAAGLLQEKTDPIYPASALQQHIEGSVQLQANIGKDGTTSKLKVLSGKPQLVTAATAAVRQWKYKPYEVNGQATEVQTEIKLDFKLP